MSEEKTAPADSTLNLAPENVNEKMTFQKFVPEFEPTSAGDKIGIQMPPRELTTTETPPKKKRGRPAGSGNKTANTKKATAQQQNDEGELLVSLNDVVLSIASGGEFQPENESVLRSRFVSEVQRYIDERGGELPEWFGLVTVGLLYNAQVVKSPTFRQRFVGLFGKVKGFFYGLSQKAEKAKGFFSLKKD